VHVNMTQYARAESFLMQKPNLRREARGSSKRVYSISWEDEAGLTHSAQVESTDSSDSGVGIRCPFEIRKGTAVYIQAQDGHPAGYAMVCHATRCGIGYTIGLKLNDATKKTHLGIDQASDHYEFLQISPNAKAETIQRVYRFLAARYHPDNPATGDPEKFLLLNRAYEVLSDPDRRARYDDFLDGVEGEVNRRLAVLSLLYRKCRANVHSPGVSILDLEKQMGFPREYLDFTIWYLRSKKYIKNEDNSELALTSSGVDYIEENYAKLPLLRKLLTAGTASRASSPDATGEAAPECVAKPYILHEGTVQEE
jgi:DnaJ-like protein